MLFLQNLRTENTLKTEDIHIINKFREMVDKRYDYDAVKLRFELPPTIDDTVIKDIKNYFLNTIYPEATQRKALEEAFKGLANYIRQPKKIWGLFGNIASAVFKFGRHFMTALKAGFSALDSFVGAKNFEAHMVEVANKNGIVPPMSDEDFADCLYQLDKEEVEKFISDIKSLFEAMINTELLHKTLEILDTVIITMKNKPHVYPKEDIEGILLGRSLLQQGYDLFQKYDEPTKKKIVELIYQNEIWFVNDVFKRREN